MKKTFTLLALFLTGILSARTWTHINPIIGDQSYILKYGKAPNETTPDQVRIATHLEYAEFVLRSKDVSEMSTEQIEKRTHLLDLLHEYWTRGVFPKNEDEQDERRPCFIDHEGTICAVGYLIEQTAGHDVAQLISDRFMYYEILEMNDPVVLNWIEECGLTQDECAMIQPGYGFSNPRRLVFSYGASYRVQDYFYHSFRIMYEKNEGQRRHGTASYKGWGAQFDWLFNGDFSAGLRYSQDLRRSSGSGSEIIPAAALMPEIFVYNRNVGMNLRPELCFYRYFGDVISLSVGYSYAIPIINESEYRAGRHDFSVRLGVDLGEVNYPHIRFPKKPKPVEQTTDTPAG